MPGVPYLNPYVQYAGFQFNYNSAFLSCCTEYSVGTSTIASAISSFNTASISSLTVSSINGMTPGIGSALSTFNTLQTSSLTVSSLNGWSPDTQVSTLYNLSTVVGGNTDPLTLSGSLWSYARYAEDVSDTNLGSIQTLSSIVGNLSTFNVASISSATISSINGWSIDTAISSIQIPSAALQNALNIVQFPNIPVSTLTWSNTAPSTLYVPISPDTSVTYLAPTVPVGAGETGWRFTKTYNLIVPSTSGLTTGATYSIVTVGTINWVAIGASAATVGVSFTYNGLPITGLLGTCVSTKKISWYSRNDLFGLSLPQSNAPATAFTKANLQNAWFLVHFNADIAQQGTLSLQIDTYAYQGTNTSNAYTGRWAYSFPLQQGFGFTAGATTNIITSNATPRLRSGFTYLLYAGDTEPTYLSPTATQYLSGASGTFAPSQTVTANSLRNPYNIYPDYPHFGMTSCLYTSNALQPAYNGAPYTDPASVEVASIYLNTNSTSPPSGTGQTVVDFNVLAMGYCGTTSSNIAFNYSNVFV